MNLHYSLVGFNKAKKTYDRLILVGVLLYLGTFISLTLWHDPQATPESTIIRSFGSLALILLHLILAIGPLSRLDSRFLPLLYNRRHLGVSMFFCALIHASLAFIQFQAWGNVSPLRSLFTTSPHYASISRFPFQVPGFFALCILGCMAATSHDFWLKNLGPAVWKRLHLGVYLAYALLLLHVLTGAAQHETSPWLLGPLAGGLSTLLSLHLLASRRSLPQPASAQDGWVEFICPDAIQEGRAKLLSCGDREIAVFKHEGKILAYDNACKHQNGPLSEGRIVAGCITCPWHGFQYRPEDGCAPPPFTEKLEGHAVKVEAGKIWVQP